MLVILALFTCVLAATPVIDSVFGTSNMKYGPSRVFVNLKPQGNNTNTTIFVKVAGTGSRGFLYPEEVWPARNLTDFSASWEMTGDTNPRELRWDDSYAFSASFDGQIWGPVFSVVKCCERLRPANQTTIVLSGNITENVEETENKIRISNSVIISQNISITSLWEIELEDQLHVIAAPSTFPYVGIRSVFPINVSGVTVRVDLEPEFSGNTVSTSRILFQFMEMTPVTGNFSEPFSISGSSPVCTLEGGFIYYGYHSWQPRDAGLYLNFTCPSCAVHPWDFLYLPAILFIIALGIIYALYRQQKYSTWQLVNGGFAIFFVTIVLVAITLEGLLELNGYRAEREPFCAGDWIRRETRDAQSRALPIAAGATLIGFGILWFNVVAFNFPREISKSSERFCGNSSPNQRIAWYFGLWLILLVIFFFSLWTPLWLILYDPDGFTGSVLVTIILAPVFCIAVLVVALSWIFLTTCCRNEKFERYFKDSSGEYLEVPGVY